jgi:4-hydroxy-2-oxoheptanedioate aldolase
VTSLRERWGEGHTTLGAWLSVPSAVSAEAAARTGFDYVCADGQHGTVTDETLIQVIQATLLGGSRPLVRVRWNEPGGIGRALDAGAEAVIAPMIDTRDDAEALVRSVRYPPRGARSFGPIAALPRDPDYWTTAGDRIAVIPMIETRAALTVLDDILAVDGIDAVYVGPADLSLSLGLPPANNDDRPEFDGALRQIVTACRAHGVVPGIHASGALAARRIEQGFRMITVSSDLVALRTRMGEELAEARAAGPPTRSGGDVY